MNKYMSYLLWLLCLTLVVASICEMSYGFMDAEGALTYLTIQRLNWEYYEYDWVVALVEIFIAAALMLTSIKINPSQSKVFFELSFRLGLGAMFIIASWHKITQPEDFSNLIAQYQFLPSFAVNLFALILAPVELLIGVLVIIGPYNKWNMRILAIMMIMFIVAIGQALIRDLGITCGCFALEGAQDKKGAYVTLVRDVILLGPIFWSMSMSQSNDFIWNIFKRK